MADRPRQVLLCGLPTPDVVDGRNDPPSEPSSLEKLVPGDVADVHAEDRSER